jgi:sporulation protein YabP
MPDVPSAPHAVTLDGRRHLEIVGVTHVDTFTDDTIVLSTHLGNLTIKGHALQIQHVDVETTLQFLQCLSLCCLIGCM